MNPSKRWLISCAVLGTAALLLAFAAFSRRSDPGPERSLPKRSKASRREAVERGLAGPAYVPPVVEPPTKPISSPQLGRAMDLSNARQMVLALKQAAASENAPVKKSVLDALCRQAGVKQVLVEELRAPAPPMVRQALEEALARIQ